MRNKKLSGAIAVGALVASTSVMAAVSDGTVVSNTCSGCHGTNGASVGATPNIGGLPEAYLASTMAAYKDGARFATVMNRVARGYDQGQLLDMAKFFAAKPWVPSSLTGDVRLVERGRQVHGASGCAGCHGASGVAPVPTFPRIAGQAADYLRFQMRDYKDPGKPIPPAATPMRGMLGAVSEEDIAALAAFYAGSR